MRGDAPERIKRRRRVAKKANPAERTATRRPIARAPAAAADSRSSSPRGHRILSTCLYYAFLRALPPRAFGRAMCMRVWTYVWTWYTRGTWCKRGIRGRGYTPAANDEGKEQGGGGGAGGGAEGGLYSRWSLLLRAAERVSRRERRLRRLAAKKCPSKKRRNVAVFLVRDQLMPTPPLSGSFLEIVIRPTLYSADRR